MASDPQVYGGAGGTTAHLDDMIRAGAALVTSGDALRRIGMRAASAAVDPVLLMSGLADAHGLARCEAALAAATIGPLGLVGVGLRVEALGVMLTAAAGVYATAERVAAELLAQARRTAGELTGRALAAGAPALAGVGAAAVGSDLLAHLVGHAGERADIAISSALQETEADLRAAAGASGAAVGGLLGGQPALTEDLVATAPGLLTGLLAPLPQAGVTWATETGVPWPPRSVADAAGLLAGIGLVSPVLRDGAVSVAPASCPPPAPAGPPGRVGDLVRGIGALDPAATPEAAPGEVRVERIIGPTGAVAWVVLVPGTQSWAAIPGAGGTPMDLATNVHGMAGHRTGAMRQVEAAMAMAGVPAGQPVLLAGHSQGGMTAAGLAADPAFRSRYLVTHVVAAGAPIAGYEIPSSVRVLALENAQDVVPSLDGAPNPDRPNWVTVRADVGGDPAVRADALAAHSIGAYAATADAVEAASGPGGDPTIRLFRATLAPFLVGEGGRVEVSDYTGVRTE